MENAIRGYKIVNTNIRGNESKYKVGGEHKTNEMELYNKGYHFYLNLIDFFNTSRFDENYKVFEITIMGRVEFGGDVGVTDRFRVVRELSRSEVVELINAGRENTGLGNTGNQNTGNWNIGDSNSGLWNMGNYNSGLRNLGNENTGDWNLGDCNSGHSNLGNGNSGSWNLGNNNSGDWNLGSGNTGAFCTTEPKIRIFDLPTDMTISEWRKSDAARILDEKMEQSKWIYAENMSDKEKKENPTYKTAGGYLKPLEFKEACRDMWNKLTKEEKEIITNIPNFNKDKFKKITSINL